MHEIDVLSQPFCRNTGKLAIVVAGLDLFKLDFQTKSFDVGAFILRGCERGNGGSGCTQRSQQPLIFNVQFLDVLGVGGGVSGQLFMKLAHYVFIAFDL